MRGGQALDVEIVANSVLAGDPLDASKVRRLCALAAASAGVDGGHLAVELVGEARIRELNAAHRAKDSATDVLSFPIDEADGIEPAATADRAATSDGAGEGVETIAGEGVETIDGEGVETIDGEGVETIDGVPRELGDVVICPAHTTDIYEAIVHGVLHLVGLDHERDDGEMLALQAEILRWETLAGTLGR
jgi:probable rRNA maturation factor